MPSTIKCETTLADFTKETGIKVIYDTYESSEAMETKVLTGGSGYDVVFSSGPSLERFGGAKLFKELNKESFTNKANLNDKIMKVLAGHDKKMRMQYLICGDR